MNAPGRSAKGKPGVDVACGRDGRVDIACDLVRDQAYAVGNGQIMAFIPPCERSGRFRAAHMNLDILAQDRSNISHANIRISGTNLVNAAPRQRFR